MKGLWSFDSKLLGYQFHDGYTVARIAVNIIFFCAIVFAFTRQPSSSPAAPFNRIRYGTYTLLW